MTENVCNRLRLELNTKDDIKIIIKKVSKLTFNGLHISYENCDSYTFKRKEVFMDKPIYVGCAIKKLSKLHMYETYYDKLQPYFKREKVQCHYIDTDAFILSLNTKNIIDDLKNLEVIFDFSNLDENHELFSKKKQKNHW